MTNFEIQSLGDDECHFMVSIGFGLSHYKKVCHSLQESIETIVNFANDKDLYDAEGKLHFKLLEEKK